MERFASTHRRVIRVCMILLCVPGISDAQFRGADFDRVDAFVEAQLREADIPGAAIAIVSREGTLHLRGFGVAGPGPVPVTPDTPFVLASVSKSITALAIMRLVEARRIELDAPIRRYLPWFEVLPREQAAQMTVRHVLNQTSGFSERDGRLHFSSRDDSDAALQTRVRDLARARLRAAPGETFQYSNANYDVAGAIIEAVTGQRYEHYIERDVFAPLKMNRSFTSVAAAREHGLAQGYRYWFGRPVATRSVPRPRALIASAKLISSAADMARLLRVHLNSGTLDGERILSPESMVALHRPAAFMSGKAHYAMGWIVDEIDGRKILWHTGGSFDFTARVVLAPDEGWAFAFLASAGNRLSGPNVDSLGREVRRLLMGEIPQPIQKASGLFTPILFALTLLPVVQLLAAVHTLHVARRWKQNPSRRPQGRLRLAWHFILPPMTSVGLVIVLVLILPRAFDTNLSGARIYAPDGGLLIVISTAFACLWAPIRTVLLLRSMRAPAEPGVAV